MYFLQVLLQVNFTENIYNFYNQNVCSGCNNFFFQMHFIAIQFYRNFWMNLCFWSISWPPRIFTEAAMIYWYKTQAKPRSKSSRQKSFWSKKVLISILITQGYWTILKFTQGQRSQYINVAVKLLFVSRILQKFEGNSRYNSRLK